MKRIVNAFLGKLNWGKRACAVFVLCATTVIALPAQTFTTLHSFDGTDGCCVEQGLVQASNGNLYGISGAGGANGGGTVFKITPTGTLTTIYNFCSLSGCSDGGYSTAGLVQAANGDFFGTTLGDASTNDGTVFKITPEGTLTTLHNFDGTDGNEPWGPLVQAASGDFYGTTIGGGANNNNALCSPFSGLASCGTVFKITPSGTLTTIYSFCSKSGCTDGAVPFAGLVQATNGDFYGTTGGGGANGDGTVFKITPSGKLTTLHSFDGTDGNYPQAGLVQATNGDFYGTTYLGGANGCCSGTVFEITPSGSLTTLHSFCSQIVDYVCTDGQSPYAGLVQGTDGNLYGTTIFGGAYTAVFTSGAGTVFKITPSGSLTTLYNFCSQSGCTDGAYPYAGLIQDTNGTFYGTTSEAGASVPSDGTVFSLSVDLGPFVETQRTYGTMGAVVKILGTDLTGATSVTFNGTAAVFTVVSPSLIAATVPAGATSGEVNVVTPSGTLLSNVPFRVLP